LNVCEVCGFILPHGNDAEKNCKLEFIKYYKLQIIIAQNEISRLKDEVKFYD